MIDVFVSGDKNCNQIGSEVVYLEGSNTEENCVVFGNSVSDRLSKERRTWNIDMGRTDTQKELRKYDGGEYLRSLLEKYSRKVDYNSETGTISECKYL